MNNEFRDELAAIRISCQQIQAAVSHAEAGLRAAEAGLARLTRRLLLPPEVKPELVFGRERWESFDQEIQTVLLDRLYAQHPDRSPYERYLEQIKRAEAEVGAARCSLKKATDQRTVRIREYLSTRDDVVRLLNERGFVAVSLEPIGMQQLLSTEWQEPLNDYLPAHIPRPQLPPTDSYRPGHTIKETAERRQRPWI